MTLKHLGVFGTMASDPAEQAKQKKLPYTGLKDLFSGRFHPTQNFLISLNPAKNLDSLTAGEVVTLPAVRRPFRFDAFPFAYPPEPGPSRRVIVDIQKRMLEVREATG